MKKKQSRKLIIFIFQRGRHVAWMGEKNIEKNASADEKVRQHENNIRKEGTHSNASKITAANEMNMRAHQKFEKV